MNTLHTLLRRALPISRRSAALQNVNATVRAALTQAGLGHLPGMPGMPGFGAPPAAAPGASEGPASAHVDADTSRMHPLVDGSHTDAAGTRRYKLFVPPATGMHRLAAQAGCAVLYPEQAQDHNPQRCWNWFKHNHQARGKGEPAILAGMVRAVVAAHGLDAERVYVAGLSAGGAMAAILGDAYPDVFAAVGVHSGLATGSARDVASAFAAMQGQATAAPAAQHMPAPPTIVFHGDQDTTVHPINAQRVLARAAPAQAVEQGRADPGKAYTRHIHRTAQGAIHAEHWVVHGAGHAWSGGSAAGSYTDPQGPNASAEMLRFFLTQQRAVIHQPG